MTDDINISEVINPVILNLFQDLNELNVRLRNKLGATGLAYINSLVANYQLVSYLCQVQKCPIQLMNTDTNRFGTISEWFGYQKNKMYNQLK